MGLLEPGGSSGLATLAIRKYAAADSNDDHAAEPIVLR